MCRKCYRKSAKLSSLKPALGRLGKEMVLGSIPGGCNTRNPKGWQSLPSVLTQEWCKKRPRQKNYKSTCNDKLRQIYIQCFHTVLQPITVRKRDKTVQIDRYRYICNTLDTGGNNIIKKTQQLPSMAPIQAAVYAGPSICA